MRRPIAELTDQLAAVEQVLSELVIARETMTEVPADAGIALRVTSLSYHRLSKDAYDGSGAPNIRTRASDGADREP